jgi:hypothetical protein
MGSADRLRELLPSLWRPEPDTPGPEHPHGDMLAGLIRSAGAGFDRLAVEAGEVMQAHWVDTADSALTAPWVARHRAAAGLPPLMPRDPGVDAHPYLDDLPRLVALIGLAPWAEPLDQRERVEDFRRRIRRIVALYRDGVGTRRALLAMARASLPLADPDAPPGLRERGVALEEAAPVAAVRAAATTRGQPDGLVGPLMRWSVENPALYPSTPTLHITSIAADAGRLDATVNPIIERFDPENGTGTGIAYAGIVPPGQTLAIEPTWTCWLARAGGLVAATAAAGEDPAAPGPFAAAAGGPPGTVAALVVGADGALWAGTNDDDTGALWRLGATGWAEVAGGLPVLHALAAAGTTLWLGHARGLSVLRVFDSTPALAPDPAGMTAPAVRALAPARDRAGGWWLATARGAARLVQGADVPFAIGPGSRSETATPFASVLVDDVGAVFFGGEAGLFRHDSQTDSWAVYRGGTADERVPDWAPWDPATPLPDPAEGFLPPVTALQRGPGAALWIGTAKGLAQWTARARRGTYGTTLHAFPDLGTDPVHALAEDARGRLWVATGRGVMLWDGLDWWQLREDGPVRLPRTEEDPLAFTHWRFARGPGQWQVQRSGAAGGFVPAAPEPVTTGEPAVHALGWSRGARALLGTLDADGFAPSGPAPGTLSLRIKPTPTRIVAGGIPATPELPPGRSDWRYLTIEEDSPPAPRSLPAWTREGRLLPPPGSRAAPDEGRFLGVAGLAAHPVFSFNPAARVELAWLPRTAFAVLVRLERRAPGETLPAIVLDRLEAALDRVRPAGVRVAIAHGEHIVRGGEHG